MGKIFVKDKREYVLEKVYNYIKNRKTLYHISCGYLSAIAIDSINKLRDTPIMEIIKNNLSINMKLANIVTYISIVIILFYIFLRVFLKMYFKNKTAESRLRKIYEKYTDPIFKGHETEGISWGLGQTLMSCPNLQNGWQTSSIRFEVDNSLYNLNVLKNYDHSLRDRNLEEEYREYVKEEFYKNFTTDSDRLMITQKPVATTDDNALLIKLKKVKWSQLQFTWNKLLTPEIKRKYIDDIFENGYIKYPNSFCLHLIVMTNDNKILLTENSINKSNDYAKTWAVSIGEQIDKDDIKYLSEDCAYYWVKRALYEELCISEEDFSKDSIHYLSINIEGDIANCSFACIVKLLLDSQTLDDRIRTEARVDNEFKRLEYIDIDDIPKELVESKKEYHPSSGIRMIYTYLHIKGASQLKYQLLKCEYNKSKA